MKRDIGLIRQILLNIEKNDSVDIECEEDLLTYQLLLLVERDYIRGIVVQEALSGRPLVQQTMSYVRMTDSGHDFLDAIRDEDIWKKIKTTMIKVGGSMTFEMITAAANEYIKTRLGIG